MLIPRPRPSASFLVYRAGLNPGPQPIYPWAFGGQCNVSDTHIGSGRRRLGLFVRL